VGHVPVDSIVATAEREGLVMGVVCGKKENKQKFENWL